MAAPKGNQFWKLRSRHGKEAIFTDSQKLWEAACEYFDWVDKNPFKESKVHGKDSEIVEVPVKRPYTLMALCIYLGVHTTYWYEFKKGKTAQTEDFPQITNAIEQIIYNQKFEGAASGFFNANIIARDLGLSDKKEVDAKLDINQITGMDIK